jgi:magnesium-protoporphyrin O-methyltransferase
MDCCQCEGLELETREWARQDLGSFRAGKLDKTTRMLITALALLGARDRDLLDIGGGIGAIQLRLLEAGATTATSVEASTAYIDVAREEARRAGRAERITYHHGDFVALAGDIPEADIVTLDRVICCYHDAVALVSLSAAKARKYYGLVYPRDTLLVRLGLWLENLSCRLKKSSFRAFVHPTQLVEGLIRKEGLAQVYRHNTLVWQVLVYERISAEG